MQVAAASRGHPAAGPAALCTQIYSQGSLDGEARVLIDPNTLSADGTVALGGQAFSEDGSLWVSPPGRGRGGAPMLPVWHLPWEPAGHSLLVPLPPSPRPALLRPRALQSPQAAALAALANPLPVCMLVSACGFLWHAAAAGLPATRGWPLPHDCLSQAAPRRPAPPAGTPTCCPAAAATGAPST